MVWTYHEVQKLRKKVNNGKQPEISEIRSLEKYIHHKKQVAHLGKDWSQKQLLRAEELLHQIQKNKNKAEVEI